jgi:hypothetical protein
MVYPKAAVGEEGLQIHSIAGKTSNKQSPTAVLQLGDWATCYKILTMKF